MNTRGPGAAKWQTALCKTRLFADQTGDAGAAIAFAALILIACWGVKQLRFANESLRIHEDTFQCQTWREFVLAYFVVL